MNGPPPAAAYDGAMDVRELGERPPGRTPASWLSLANNNPRAPAPTGGDMRSLKIFSAAVAVGTVVCAGTASAADLAARPMPYAAPAPAFSWTGCYVGVHGGAGVLHDQGFQSGGGVTEDLRADRHGTGGLAGGQIGCNYQTGMLVLGI